MVDTHQFPVRMCHPDIKATVELLLMEAGDFKLKILKSTAYHRLTIHLCNEIRLTKISKGFIDLWHK